MNQAWWLYTLQINYFSTVFSIQRIACLRGNVVGGTEPHLEPIAEPDNGRAHGFYTRWFLSHQKLRVCDVKKGKFDFFKAFVYIETLNVERQSGQLSRSAFTCAQQFI